jgi:hypothetical protein
VADGVEIHPQRHRHFAHGRQLAAPRQGSGGDGGEELLADLHIDRHAVVAQPELGQESVLVCMH